MCVQNNLFGTLGLLASADAKRAGSVGAITDMTNSWRRGHSTAGHEADNAHTRRLKECLDDKNDDEEENESKSKTRVNPGAHGPP